MKNSSLIKKISSLFFILLLASCISRLPQTSKSEKVITKHFNHYVKDFPNSIFGKEEVEKVEILEQKEIQRNIVNTTALVTMKEGKSHKVHMTLLYKLPLGWRIQGWEVLNSSQN